MPTLSPALFDFLEELAENNTRAWFTENKARYEAEVKEPCLSFIRGFEGPLHELVSPHFLAIARSQGGSMFRIHRDVRFSKDKRPYKTHAGLQFRHAQASRDVHAPGLYLGLEPGGSMLGSGVWHPQGDALLAIRRAIVDEPERWVEARDALLAAGWEQYGESLKRGPKGFDRDHPLIDDLKRKDFIFVRRLRDDEPCVEGFEAQAAQAFSQTVPALEFLCDALGLPC